MSTDAWAGLADQFVDHYEKLYGQVRIYVLREHLRAHLPPAPARIVDIGGGAGHEAINFARDGYDVTVVDPSPTMLGHAAARLADEPDEVAARVRLVEGDGVDALELLDGERFSGVLCHGVLMYLDDPEPLVGVLCGLADDDGVVSIVTKNAATLAVQPAHEGDWRGALAAFDATRQVNGLGVDTRGDTVDGLGDLLRLSDVEPEEWYGVRLFTEGWARDRPPDDPDDDVLAVELEASRRDPYRQLSRLFHLIGRRRPRAG